MGAIRVVATVTMLGIGAGTCFALAVIPALAPYRPDRSAAPPSSLAGQQRDASEDAYPFALPPRQAQAGPEDPTADGNLIGELPRWVEEGAGWVAFGRDALQDLRAWSDREDSDGAAYSDRVPRFGQHWRDDEPDGYVEREYGRREWGGGGPDENDQAEDYAPPWGWPPGWDAGSPRLARPDAQDDDGPVSPRQAQQAYAPKPTADAAADAAARAREAARDVRDAERTQ